MSLDQFTSGGKFLMLGRPVREAMRWGAVNSSAVITKVGAQAGLLYKTEIESKLKTHHNFQARQI